MKRNIPLFKVYMSPEVDGPLLETVHSGWLGQCGKNAEFEKALSERVGNPHCATVCSGTAALHLAYRLMGLEPDDEVITTPATCFCAQCPALQERAALIWADVQRDTINIDPASVRENITSQTRAIYVVWWGGYPADMKDLYDIAYEYGLYVLVDGAHGFGATYRGRPLGACGYADFEMMSFQAIKQLTTGDGGALFCKNDDDYARAKLLRWYGIDREGPKAVVRCEDDIKEWGYKYHMNDIASVLGLVNLNHVDANNAIAESNAQYYRENLAGIDGLTLTQPSRDDRTSANWLFTLLAEDKPGLESALTNAGIGCNQVHARNDTNSCVKEFWRALPNTDYVYERLLCIPVGWWVTPEDREYVVHTIKKGW